MVDYQVQKVYISARFLEVLMLIKISNLKEGAHQYKFDEPIESVGLEHPFIDRISANLNLYKTHNQVVLETQLELTAEFECDRCNSIFQSALHTDYKMVYLFGKHPEEYEEALNIVYLPLEASEIVLDTDVRDYALLAIPMKKLCSEECKGLCPLCGKNLNEGDCDCKKKEFDTRWLPLQELKNKIDNN